MRILLNIIAMTLLIAYVFAGETDHTRNGAECKIDQDCSPPFITCNEQICGHKPLFPMLPAEIYSLCFLLITLMFSVLVGISGGSIVIPTLMYMMGFNAKESVALANFITFMTTGVKYLMSLSKSHPDNGNKTIIEYNAVTIMTPTGVLWSVLGGLAATVLPDTVILLLLVAILVYASYQGIRRYRKYVAKELSEQAATSYIAVYDFLASRQVSQEISIPNRLPSQEWMFDRLEKIQSRKFYFRTFYVVCSAILFTACLSFLKGGRGFESVIGIVKCSEGEAYLLGGYIILMSLVAGYAFRVVSDIQRMKDTVNWSEYDQKDVVYSRRVLMKCLLMSSFNGFVSTIAGLGGGFFYNPFLMSIGFEPLIASWTVSCLTLISKIGAVMVHLVSGDILMEYALFYGVIVSMGIIISENLFLAILKRYGGQRFLILTFAGMTILSLFLVGYVGIEKWLRELETGKDIWEVQKYC